LGDQFGDELVKREENYIPTPIYYIGEDHI